MQEKWIVWSPEPLLPMYYYLDDIRESEGGGLTIIYEGQESFQKFKISFKQQVHAFRYGNESFRLETIYNLNESYDQKLYKGQTTFKAMNSTFLLSFLEHSSGDIDSSKFIHFLFGTTDDILDVIASEEPTCEMYNEEKE